MLNPIPAYKFEVFIYDRKTLEAIEDKLWFEKVGGFGVSFNIKECQKSADFNHPTAEYKTLTLTRGLFGPVDSGLYKRLDEQAMGLNFSSLCIVVTMYDTESNPNSHWLFYNVFPSDWNVSELDANKNGYLVETFSFKYQFYQVI